MPSSSALSAQYRAACKTRTPVSATLHIRWLEAISSVAALSESVMGPFWPVTGTEEKFANKPGNSDISVQHARRPRAFFTREDGIHVNSNGGTKED
jgi:hypothetical protein